MNRKSKKIQVNDFAAIILEIIEKIENEPPEKIVYLNIFNTGIILSSEDVKKQLFRFLKDRIYKKR
jgi:uncharacterized Fe-S cluster-containing MiaB family protein